MAAPRASAVSAASAGLPCDLTSGNRCAMPLWQSTQLALRSAAPCIVVCEVTRILSKSMLA